MNNFLVRGDSNNYPNTKTKIMIGWKNKVFNAVSSLVGVWTFSLRFITEAAELTVVLLVIEARDQEMSQVLLGDGATRAFTSGHDIVLASWALWCTHVINVT